MAKEIVAWCDRHLAKQEHVTGSELRIAINGRESALDLCASCTDDVVGPVLELLKEFGQPVREARSVTGAAFNCSVCGRPFIKRGSWRNHMRKVHSMTAAQVDAVAETGTPDSGTAGAERQNPGGGGEAPNPLPFVCEEPDCGRRFEKVQGLNMHQMRAHGVLQGDPKNLEAASA